MKKSVLFLFLIPFILVSCSKFSDSSKFFDELQNAITLANTPDVTVSVRCNNSYGTVTSGSGGTYKLGTDNLKLSFSEADAYQFVKWQVYDAEGVPQNCTEKDAVYITDASSPVTTFSLKKEVSGYYINAECSLRPAVTNASPSDSVVVNRDRDIIFTFNQQISSDNFRYSAAEIAKMNIPENDLLLDSDSKAYGYVKNSITYFKNIKIRNAKNSSANLLQYFEAPVVSGQKLTIAPKKGLDERFSLDNDGFKFLEVTLNSSINNNGIYIRNAYVHTYKVGNTSDKQTDISFTADSVYGIVSPVGTKTYNAGDEVALKFQEKAEYKLVGWKITGNESEIITFTDESYDKSTLTVSVNVTVLEGDGNLVIQPVCVKRPVANFTPEYVSSGVNFDSELKLTFSNKIEKDSFYYTQTECESYGNSAIKIGNPVYAIELGNNRLFKNIQITDQDGKNLNKFYKNLVLSEDGKSVTLEFDSLNIPDFSSSSVKDMNLVLGSDIYYNYTNSDGLVSKITLNEKTTYPYRVKNSSTAKASFTISAMDNETSMGTLNYSGNQEFNLGESFTVSFEPKSEYNFVKWSVTGYTDDAITLREDNNKLTVTVKSAVSGVKIVPVCTKLENVSMFIASDNGSVSPSGYVTYKEKDTFTLIYTPNEKFSFRYWTVVNEKTGEVLTRDKYSQYFSFEDIYSTTTKVTVKLASSDLKLVPVSYEKPVVYAHDPDGTAKSVDRDKDIRVFVNKSIDENSLYYSESEISELLDNGNTILYGEEEYIDKAYGYIDISGNYYFKNIKITSRSDINSNYLRYYGCPYLYDNSGTIICIPTKKVIVDNLIIRDYLPPSLKEILVTLGTEYCHLESDGTLVNLFDSNLIWSYKTGAGVDTTVPYIKLDDANAPEIKLSGLRYDNTESKYMLHRSPNDPLPSSLSGYEQYYLRAVNGELLLNLDLSIADEGSNLKSCTMFMEQLNNYKYEYLANEEDRIFRQINLPLTIDDTVGTYSETINVREKFNLSSDGSADGLYKIYFEIRDLNGNYINTKESAYYYVLFDTKAASDLDLTRFFYKADGTVILSNLARNTAFDNASSSIIDDVNNSLRILDVNRPYNSSLTVSGVPVGEKFHYTVENIDHWGNVNTVTKEITTGAKPGMCLYSNGNFADTYYSGLTVYAFAYDVTEENKIKLVLAETGGCVASEIENTISSANSSVPSSLNSMNLSFVLPKGDDLKKIHSLDDKFKAMTGKSIQDNNGTTYITVRFLISVYDGQYHCFYQTSSYQGPDAKAHFDGADGYYLKEDANLYYTSDTVPENYITGGAKYNTSESILYQLYDSISDSCDHTYNLTVWHNLNGRDYYDNSTVDAKYVLQGSSSGSKINYMLVTEYDPQQ